MCPPVSATTPLNEHEYPETVPSCVPADSISQAAYQEARSQLHPAILNHSLRVFLYAQKLSEREATAWHSGDRLPLLFTACVFHDIGTAPAHDGPQRFEVEGGDAATAFLRRHGVPAADAHEAWTAIALHTSPGIAERIAVLARIVRKAILVDFRALSGSTDLAAADTDPVERAFPRNHIEKILGDAVVEQALRDKGKAPASSWAGGMLQYKLANPEAEGVNAAFHN